ncbi:potassium/proton antiporter [Bacillus tuaregi]|uniref:potassium/proton antiporter n=1 Tax=Bacillus tuaregi TaxID=1816695 RepID=UPI000AA30075|nr:potassium/proton antiporter [Bacillus tuaregi]
MDAYVWNTDAIILLISVLLLAGVITTKLSARLGVPSLVLFILVGMLLGNFVYFDSAHVAQMIGVLALIIILFEGGLQTNMNTIRSVITPSISLATIGVFITTALVAIPVKFIMGVDWLTAFLLGSIIGSTDAAAVFAVLKGQNIKPKIGATLEAESGSNDPMAVFLTLAIIQLITVPDSNFFTLMGSFLLQMGLGALLGVLFGKLAIWGLNRIRLDSSGLYPVFASAFVILTYGITASLKGSGLLAVYIAGILIGNADITYKHSIVRFSEGFAWMMQISMFVILGLLVFPAEVFTGEIMLKGVIISAILMLVARPVAVYLSTLKMGFTHNEKLFLSWAGLKGAVPIVLATYPLLANVDGGQEIFNIVFFVVLISCLVQGSTITPLAHRLKLIGPQKATPIYSIELLSLGKADAEMLAYEMEGNAEILGQNLNQIPFPKGALVNAVIRDDKLITPSGNTVLKEGDFLYILTKRKDLQKVKQLLKKEKQPTEEKIPASEEDILKKAIE